MTKRVEVEFVVTGVEYGYGKLAHSTHSIAAVRQSIQQITADEPIEVEGSLSVRGVPKMDPNKRVRATLIFEELE